MSLKLSVVIPLYNEADNIAPLFAALDAALSNITHEIVFVDDASSDGTAEAIMQMKRDNVQLIIFEQNAGQSAALHAGIAAARGEYIATIDGDLQNDPADIPLMLERLEKERADIIIGWRKHRKDNIWLRTLPSQIFNQLIRWCTGSRAHDHGCSSKLMRASLAKQLNIYGGLHRFIPILAMLHGARIIEIPVRHHPRSTGVSKYGASRLFKASRDLLLMVYLLNPQLWFREWVIRGYTQAQQKKSYRIKTHMGHR